MESTTVIAIDLAKSVFEIGVSNRPGKVAERHRVARGRLLRFFAQREPTTVIMEACGSASYWARRLRELAHEPVLLPAQHVRPYRRGNKTDRSDVKALLEAYRDESIMPVPPKSPEQQALAALHRMRSAWMGARTARMNTVRAVLREIGVVIPQGPRHVAPRVWALLEDADSPIADALRPVLAAACEEIRDLEARAKAAEQQLKQLAKQTPVVARLQTIPGVGLLTATALVAAVGDVQRFPSGRHFASYLGLTPREHSSGSVRRLGGITKRGDSYLRTLLIHGARAVLLAANRVQARDRLRHWAVELNGRSCHNKTAVAVANKLARIVWAVWRNGENYRPALVA